MKQSSDADKISLKPATSRKGWKTIRLFVSSTFKDFHQEREVLVKEVRICAISEADLERVATSTKEGFK